MSKGGDAELLQGIQTDLNHSKAGTHASKLTLEQDGDDAHRLTMDISAHAEAPPHHTKWLRVFVNDTPAGEFHPEPTYFSGKVTVNLTGLDAGDEVRVHTKCNLHGVWESSVTV